ncbi:hypothetical protein AB0D57_36530 [Streptomyces sp. NPDC048275]
MEMVQQQLVLDKLWELFFVWLAALLTPPPPRPPRLLRVTP